MTDTPTPAGWRSDLRAVAEAAGKAFGALTYRMRAMAALGHLLQQDPASARAALAALPAAQRAAAAGAAHALARMAEEPE